MGLVTHDPRVSDACSRVLTMQDEVILEVSIHHRETGPRTQDSRAAAKQQAVGQVKKL